DMRSLILIVAFLHQEDITTNNYLNLSILKQLQEAQKISGKSIFRFQIMHSILSVYPEQYKFHATVKK
ncbi:MAG: hypothetical protein QXL15_02445, partial [Candidatus Korarchaeota archaeon]